MINLFFIADKKYIAIEFEYDKTVVDTVKKVLPIAKWDKDRRVWIVPNKPHNITQVISSLSSNKLRLVIHGDIQQAYEKAQKLEEKKAEQINEIQQQKLIETDVDFSSYLKIEPFGYQKQDFNFLQSRNGCGILGLEPGLGKTLEAISYCSYHKYRTIIICPATLKWNWEREINKFTNDSCRILESNSKLERTERSNYLIINFELLLERKNKKVTDARKSTLLERLIWLVENGKYNCVVIDEAHRMKNQSAKSTKTIHKHFSKVEHRILLTGTPIKSRPIEYFSLLKFIDKKRWNNKTEFAMRYCDPKKSRFGTDFSGASNLKELHHETLPYIIRRTKEEVLKDLPPKIYSVVPIELHGVTRSHYNKLEEGFINSLDQIQLGDPRDLSDDFTADPHISKGDKITALAKLQLVKQYTSQMKVKYAEEIITTVINSGKKIVVFSQYLAVIHELHRIFSKSAVILVGGMKTNDRRDAVDRFMTDPKCNVFIGSLMAASVGLTLTSADTVLMVDEGWTPGDNDQAHSRIHRIGQRNSANIITLICNETIDEYIHTLLAEKREVIARVIDNRSDNVTEKLNIFDDLIKLYKKKRKKI